MSSVQAPPVNARRASFDDSNAKPQVSQAPKRRLSLGSATPAKPVFDKLPKEAEDDLPKDFFCSITQAVMLDPVRTPAGHFFERAAITDWLKDHATEPLSRDELQVDQLVSAPELRQAIAKNPAALWLAEHDAAVRARKPQAVPARTAPAIVMPEALRLAQHARLNMDYGQMEMGYADVAPMAYRNTRLDRMRNISLPNIECNPLHACCKGTLFSMYAFLGTAPTWFGTVGGLLASAVKPGALMNNLAIGTGVGAGVNVALAALIYSRCARG